MATIITIRAYNQPPQKPAGRGSIVLMLRQNGNGSASLLAVNDGGKVANLENFQLVNGKLVGELRWGNEFMPELNTTGGYLTTKQAVKQVAAPAPAPVKAVNTNAFAAELAAAMVPVIQKHYGR